MLASPVPVIVYVYPTGSRSASAGFYILEAADIAAMAPGTNTGAAHPVLMGTTMDPVMKEKLENDSAAFIRSYVAKRGRNVEVAESAVRQSKSFTEQEALQQHLIDYVAKDHSDLLKQIDGKTVTRFDGRTLVLHTAGAQITDYHMSLKEQILSFLMDPNIAFLILMIGLAAIYAEFNHPGAIVPGVVGLIFVVLAVFALNLLPIRFAGVALILTAFILFALEAKFATHGALGVGGMAVMGLGGPLFVGGRILVVLAVFALNLLPIRFAGVALILTAFILFALEAKFATHGALGVGGMAVMVLGALLLVDGPIPQMRIRPVTAVAVSISFGLITIFLLNIALRARRGKVVTGEKGLIGELGTAQTTVRPEGKVFVDGEIWNAYSPTGADPGQTVRVTAIHDLILTVEPVSVGVPAGSTLK